jgi:iron complex transport system ATP-binding protein
MVVPGDTPRAKPILQVRNIEASYDRRARTLVLGGVSIDLRPGEFVALIGPNGSGKSSLIKSLSRTLKPVNGVIYLSDVDLYDGMTARNAALKVGVVPQETNLAFEFTVREVVAMGRAPHQPSFSVSAESSADRDAIADAMQRADISEEFGNKLISTLSGGERQRVIIARALAQNAELLLLDEPTASLDIGHEAHLLAWLVTLAKREGRTILAALHDLNVAAAYADRIIVIDGGKCYADGTPAEVITSAMISQVYGINSIVSDHPVTGRPYFLAVPESVV